MRTHLLFLGAVGLLQLSPVMAQIPNGGFENWTTVDGHLDPDDWITTNDQLATLGVISCEKGTPGAVGAAYVKLTSKVFPGTSSVIPGVLAAGNTEMNMFGFPSMGRPAALTGSVRYDIQDGDVATISVGFILNNVTVGAGTLSFTGSQSGWVNFSIPIEYVDGSILPDTANISVTSSGSEAVEGSTISLDNLSLGGAASGIQEVQATVGLHVYPTLTSDVLNVVADQALAQVDVLDLTGRALMHQGVNAESITLDVSGLNTGRYLVQVRLADGRRVVRSFVKQ